MKLSGLISQLTNIMVEQGDLPIVLEPPEECWRYYDNVELEWMPLQLQKSEFDRRSLSFVKFTSENPTHIQISLE